MDKWDPVHYNSNSSLPRQHSKYCLENFGQHIQISESDAILDIGCGDGYVSTNILLKYLGGNYKELVGIDCNERMIEYANKRYGGNTTIFKVLDIKAEELPKEFENRFNHVFSFNCFNWLGNDQSKALLNTNKMLKKGGDTLLFFTSDFPLHRVYEKLSTYSKYAPYMKDIHEKIPAYFNYDNKHEWFKKLLEENEFRIIFCHVLDMSYRFPSTKKYLENMKTISLFQFPEEMLEEYYVDFMNESRNMETVLFENNTDAVTINYEVIVASAVKV